MVLHVQDVGSILLRVSLFIQLQTIDGIDQDSGAANSMLLLLLQLLIREEKKNQNRRSLKISTATLVHSGTLPVCLASCAGQTNLLGSKPVVPVPGLG